jgi:hypothetical protein
MKNIARNRDKIMNEYNDEFDDGGRGYGWACKYFNNPGILDIAEATNIEHLKPYYELTHKLIHSGSTSATYSMGRLQNINKQPDSELPENHQLLAGPSNYGFADTAQNTAISLSQVTTAFLNLQPTPLRLVKLQALQHMVDDIAGAFVETQLAIEKEEAAKQ